MVFIFLFFLLLYENSLDFSRLSQKVLCKEKYPFYQVFVDLSIAYQFFDVNLMGHQHSLLLLKQGIQKCHCFIIFQI